MWVPGYKIADSLLACAIFTCSHIVGRVRLLEDLKVRDAVREAIAEERKIKKET